MNNCTLSQGSILSCSTVGGVKRVWIGQFVNGLQYTTALNGVITGITTSGITVYEFEQQMEHAGLAQSGNFSPENGTVFFQTDLSIKIIGLTAETRKNMIELSKGSLMAIVESNSGEFYYCGANGNSGKATAGNANVGTLMGDLNGLEITISFKSAEGVMLMDGDLVGTAITVL